MRLTLFARWRNARKAAASGKDRRTRLHLETLEARLLPSLTPHLLKDINPGAGSSSPANFTAVGPTAFFAASDGVRSKALRELRSTARAAS